MFKFLVLLSSVYLCHGATVYQNQYSHLNGYKAGLSDIDDMKHEMGLDLDMDSIKHELEDMDHLDVMDRNFMNVGKYEYYGHPNSFSNFEGIKYPLVGNSYGGVYNTNGYQLYNNKGYYNDPYAFPTEYGYGGNYGNNYGNLYGAYGGKVNSYGTRYTNSYKK